MAVEQELGTAILPSKTVKTGASYADRPRADGVGPLLLTCDTVSEPGTRPTSAWPLPAQGSRRTSLNPLAKARR